MAAVTAWRLTAEAATAEAATAEYGGGGDGDTFEKNGKRVTRKLNPDKSYITTNGKYNLPGRSVMLIRNVGHLMTNPAILMKNGDEIPEGIMDAMITSLIAIHDIKNNKMNSRTGSV